MVPLTAENELMPRQQAEILVPFGELKSPANALCASLRETKFLGPTRLGFGQKTKGKGGPPLEPPREGELERKGWKLRFLFRQAYSFVIVIEAINTRKDSTGLLQILTAKPGAPGSPLPPGLPSDPWECKQKRSVYH